VATFSGMIVDVVDVVLCVDDVYTDGDDISKGEEGCGRVERGRLRIHGCAMMSFNVARLVSSMFKHFLIKSVISGEILSGST